jgi:hypothetical protein
MRRSADGTRKTRTRETVRIDPKSFQRIFRSGALAECGDECGDEYADILPIAAISTARLPSWLRTSILGLGGQWASQAVFKLNYEVSAALVDPRRPPRF